ncbi:hypothetical protein AVEN_147960-1 [Araneus ventricosus]|uniref:Uncharacterized protein n=1 Tax=Araneus ventricosus TaxID=182803 RepID=A0A4Y2WS02_ARAVE|nr:hypothetical protein AVEN_44571-1 [Araneus ventricosus]GBO08044.1 hypothetical protein AVEN_200034-1 [Araneus ventricosus]GBO39403.1 hypothetical protein AVEN_135972-1 [Araneus ventricosus]GBO39404.1 hypothetical protein AVEN_147960-1 [Araneus ventricosus]
MGAVAPFQAVHATALSHFVGTSGLRRWALRSRTIIFVLTGKRDPSYLYGRFSSPNWEVVLYKEPTKTRVSYNCYKLLKNSNRDFKLQRSLYMFTGANKNSVLEILYISLKKQLV